MNRTFAKIALAASIVLPWAAFGEPQAEKSAGAASTQPAEKPAGTAKKKTAPFTEPVKITGAWARTTAPGASTAAVYMKLESAVPLKLVQAVSEASKSAEVHEMKMEDGIMRMRAVPRLALPTGVTVQLKPGSYHVMLMDLKQPLKKGDTVTLMLRLEHKDSKIESLDVRAEVRDLTASSSNAPAPVR